MNYKDDTVAREELRKTIRDVIQPGWMLTDERLEALTKRLTALLPHASVREAPSIEVIEERLRSVHWAHPNAYRQMAEVMHSLWVDKTELVDSAI